MLPPPFKVTSAAKWATFGLKNENSTVKLFVLVLWKTPSVVW